MRVRISRDAARDAWIRWLIVRARSIENLSAPAVVFAPHPDDETLGCGGTIARKVKAGATVHVVILTDGRRSHRHLMPEDHLARVRSAEAQAAASILGVDHTRLHQMGYADGTLSAALADVEGAVASILRDIQPEEVYVPYRRDGPPDHEAANRAVRGAIRRSPRRVRVLEYPVWLWTHWPTVRPAIGSRRDVLAVTLRSFRAIAAFAYRFTAGVEIEAVRELKRAALQSYASQMTRLMDDTRWLTLPDLFAGDFVPCFFRSRELFYSYTVNAAGARRRRT